jgi:RNA polymerase sigma factor (sigma-70 family)
LRKNPISPTSPSMKELDFTKKLVQRDREAWQEFVERYTPVIYEQVRRCLRKYKSGSSPEQDAGDLYLSVFQSFLEKDCRKFRQFEGRCSLARWVRMATTSHVIDLLRKERQEVSLEAEDSEGLSLFDRIPNRDPSAEEELLEGQRRDALREVLRDWSEEDRLLISLTYEQEMPADQIAAVLNVSRETVYTRRHRLHHRLRKALEGKLFE